MAQWHQLLVSVVCRCTAAPKLAARRQQLLPFKFGSSIGDTPVHGFSCVLKNCGKSRDSETAIHTSRAKSASRGPRPEKFGKMARKKFPPDQQTACLFELTISISTLLHSLSLSFHTTFVHLVRRREILLRQLLFKSAVTSVQLTTVYPYASYLVSRSSTTTMQLSHKAKNNSKSVGPPPGTRPVAVAHQLDQRSLVSYLRQHVQGFPQT